LLTACDSIRRARPLLGTFVEIAATCAAPDDMNRAVAAAFAAVAKVHDLMSFHETASDVSRLNRLAAINPVCVHPWTYQVLRMALDLSRLSAGVFDIAVAPVMQRMGLLPRARGGQPSALHKDATSEAIELLPRRRVRFNHRATTIDLGGIAKGFAVDRAIEALREHGVLSGLVNAGGDLAAFGPSLHTVAIRDPRCPSRLLCRVDLSNAALASSGRRFDPFFRSGPLGSSVIDPMNRSPARAVGATVRASCCMIADALTKVVMVAGRCASTLLDHYRAGALLVAEDGAVHITGDLKDALCLAA
jgi:thiamine biosynthesis lipoprotein